MTTRASHRWHRNDRPPEFGGTVFGFQHFGHASRNFGPAAAGAGAGAVVGRKGGTGRKSAA